MIDISEFFCSLREGRDFWEVMKISWEKKMSLKENVRFKGNCSIEIDNILEEKIIFSCEKLVKNKIVNVLNIFKFIVNMG